MYKILIIEDDLVMAGAIKKEMEAWGNEARYVEDFAKVLETFAEYGPHLVLLDITLPFYNGYHWCSEIRKISSVPVIFISSAADNMNIIMAMNMGGDDFVAKPFDLSVLTAKIQALLRRTYDLSGKVPMLEHRGAILNLYDTTMTYNGEKIELTKNEFRSIIGMRPSDDPRADELRNSNINQSEADQALLDSKVENQNGDSEQKSKEEQLAE